MGTRLNRYYNNPEIGAAFENLGSLFAPMEATDILAYAQAAKARTENQGLEALYGMAGDPNADLGAFDRWGAATGRFNPTQGFGARDMADATNRFDITTDASTARYGTDVAARTSAANNAADNARAMEAARLNARAGLTGDLFGPLSQGQVRPAVPANVMDVFGMPAIDSVTGLPKPLSETEVEGALLNDAIMQGRVTPADAASAYTSDIPIEQVIGENGSPVNVTRADAVGQQPYINPGSSAASQFKTYTTPDGRTGTARLDPNGTTLPVDAMTGDPLPAGTITGDIVDSRGGMTTSAETSVQLRGIAIKGALSTVDQLQQLISANPNAQGLVGDIRGTAQDLIQTGSNLGQFVGGATQEMMAAVQQDPTLQATVGPMYDTSIPAIDMLENVLAWQLAKTFGGDRVSNEQLRTAQNMIGGRGILANPAASTARLSGLREWLVSAAKDLEPMQAGPIQTGLNPLLGSTPPPAISNGPVPLTATGPNGEKIKLEGGAWVPVR